MNRLNKPRFQRWLLFTSHHFLIVFLLIVLNISGLSTYAQTASFYKGYYISLTNDTIFGFIKNTGRGSLSHQFKFMTDSLSSTTFEKYPAEVNSFYFAPDNHFLSYTDTILDKEIFIRQLTAGPISLYEYTNTKPHLYFLIDDSTSYIYRLTKKDKAIEKDGRVYRHEDTRYKGMLKLAMAGCEEIYNKIERTDYNSTSLIKLVQSYNECVSPGIEKHSKQKKTHLQIGIQTAGLFTLNQKVYTTRFDGLDFTGKPSFSAGLAFNISFEHKISLDVGIVYAQYKSELLGYSYGPNLPYSENVYLKYTYIDVPLTIRYEILNRSIKPLLYGTYLFGFLVDEEFKVESNYPGAEEDRTINHEFLKIGFEGGVGLSFYDRVLLKTGYYWQLGLNGVNVVTKIQGVEVSLEFYFNKR